MNKLRRDELSVVTDFLDPFEAIQLAKSKVVLFDWKQLEIMLKRAMARYNIDMDILDFYGFCTMCPKQYRSVNDIPHNICKQIWFISCKPMHIYEIVKLCSKSYKTIDGFYKEVDKRRLNHVIKINEFKNFVNGIVQQYGIDDTQFFQSPFNECYLTYKTYIHNIYSSMAMIDYNARRIVMLAKISECYPCKIYEAEKSKILYEYLYSSQKLTEKEMNMWKDYIIAAV